MKLSIPVGKLDSDKLEDGISTVAQSLSEAVQARWGDAVEIYTPEKQYEVTDNNKSVTLKFLSQSIRLRQETLRGINIDLRWRRSYPEVLTIEVYERSRMDDRLEKLAYIISIAIAVIVVLFKFSFFGKQFGQLVGVLIFIPVLIVCFIANRIIHSCIKSESTELMHDAEFVIKAKMFGQSASANT